MNYYHLPSDTERHPGRLETKLADNYRIGPPDTGWTPELAALCGFVVITPALRPADTATHTSERTVVRTGNTVAEVWTVVAKSEATLASDTAAQNRTIIEARAATIITQMDAITTSTGTLSTAQLSGAVRQIAAAVRGLTRLAANVLGKAD